MIRQKKKGITLIETLMAIGIFSIGMTGFALLFSHAWKNNAYTLEMGQSAMAVSRGVAEISKNLRGVRQADSGSYPIKSANSNDLVVYCDYDKDGTAERLHFYKNGTDILMGITSPTNTMPKSYPSGDETTKVVASRIVNESDEPIFFYFDKNYSGDLSEVPMSVPAQVDKIRIVEIHLKINIDPNRAPDNVEMRTFVELRNLNDYNKFED